MASRIVTDVEDVARVVDVRRRVRIVRVAAQRHDSHARRGAGSVTSCCYRCQVRRIAERARCAAAPFEQYEARNSASALYERHLGTVIVEGKYRRQIGDRARSSVVRPENRGDSLRGCLAAPLVVSGIQLIEGKNRR